MVRVCSNHSSNIISVPRHFDCVELFNKMEHLDEHMEDHNHDEHIGETFDRFTHFHEVPLLTSDYFNTCWTKIDFATERYISEDPSFHYTNAQSVTEGVFNILLSISGIILNLLVILAILRNKEIRKEYLTPSILSISCTDLIFSMLSIPSLSIISLTGDVPFPSGCQFGSYVGYGLWLCSAFNLVGIAVLRCFAVYFPRKTSSNKFKYTCRVLPIMGWIISFFALIPTLAGKFGRFGLECKSFRCQIISIGEDREPTTFSPLKCYSGTILLCGILMFLFNVATFGQIRKYSRSLFKKIKAINIDAAKDISNKEKYVGKMVLKVTAAYAIVYLPVIISRRIDPNAIIKYPWLIVPIHLLLNSLVVIDPLVYILSHDKYREEVKRIYELMVKGKKNNKESSTQDSQTTDSSS